MNETGLDNYTYCSLDGFNKSYKHVHGYLSLLVCVFGSIANVLNVCVLTTKDMRWPTNYILTGLAVADLLVMIEYIPFAIHHYVRNEHRYYIQHYTYGWGVFMAFHGGFTIVFHFISCCLTVILAIWRYIAISHPQNTFQWCSPEKTKLAIFLTYLICPLVCLPVLMSLQVIGKGHICEPDGRFLNESFTPDNVKVFNRTIYVVDHSGSSYRQLSFVVYGVVLKLVPCILLTILSWRLIKALVDTKKRRRLLLDTSLPLDVINEKSIKKQRQLEKEQQADRTTKMLLAVLLLFLITEFPQAILGLLSVLIGKNFEEQCYMPLGEDLVGVV